MSVTGTLVEAKMCKLTLESTHFIFNKCAICTHDGESAKFSTNSHETDYSEVFLEKVQFFLVLSVLIYDEGPPPA